MVKSLEAGGERGFTFLNDPPLPWKSIRIIHAIERLHEEFTRRIKTRCVLPHADTACMRFWALLAQGLITLRKVDDGEILPYSPTHLTSRSEQCNTQPVWRRTLNC